MMTNKKAIQVALKAMVDARRKYYHAHVAYKQGNTNEKSGHEKYMEYADAEVVLTRMLSQKELGI